VRLLRKVVPGFGWVLGVYLIGRAIAEILLVRYGDPASYRDDWGGPSLAGVLAVHCGFGVVSLVLIGGWLRARIRRRGAGAEPAGLRRRGRVDG
jgi:hypothetical protein